jgi:tripartite-type tricarboxylate transporter receptor subunit TctC
MSISRRFCIAVSAAALLAAALPAAQAEEWPSRPITMVVPFPAGGSADAVARLIALELGDKLKQQVVVENRGGAGGNIGGAVVARAKADGYTLLFATPGPGANNKLLYSKLTYDPEKDFTPIIEVADSPLIIVASTQTPIKSIPDLVAYAKKNPGKLNVGVPGNGTLGHFAAALLQRQTGTKLTIVPYRGSAPLITDLLGGQVNIGSDFITAYVPQVKSGKITPLAVLAPQRSPLLPDVPTAAEAGFTNFDAVAWYSIVGPAGMPEPVVMKINKIVNDYLKSDVVKQKFGPLALRPVGGTPEHLKKLVADEIAKWRPIVEEANIKLN